MQNPKLIPVPFATNGIKDQIPLDKTPAMDDAAASWRDGFPSLTMNPVFRGGVPPRGEDFNGVLNQISENIVFMTQGGRFKFDLEYALSIGGYPKGATLQTNDESAEYQSLINNNLVDFNTASPSEISEAWRITGLGDAADVLNGKLDKSAVTQHLGTSKTEIVSQDVVTQLGTGVVGSFENGLTHLPYLTNNKQQVTIENEYGIQAYCWNGEFPKEVPIGSTPESTGGIAKNAWDSVGDASLRSDLATDGGKLIYINGKQSLDDYISDMPSFERWGSADALDNTAALYAALAWMKTRGVGHLYFPKKYRFNETIPLDTGISYNGNGKSTSGLVIAHNEDALKVISGVKYSPEVNNLIIQHESLNSQSTGIYGVNGNQMRLSNVQVTGFKRGVVTGGASYYSNFDRVRVLNCDEGFVFDSGSRGITASDCSADAKINGFIFNAETDSINNISLINPKAEKIETNGVGFLFKAGNGKNITGVSALSGRFDPKSTENGQVFIKTESENATDISNIIFIDPTVFNTPTANMLVGNNAFEQVTILAATLGFGNIKATGMFVHDVENLTRAARLRYIHSDTRPRIEVRNRENSLPVGIRASNVEAVGVLNVNNQNSGREAGIAVAECTWEKPFKLGEWYLWFSSTGVFRKKNGVPLSDGDGAPV